MEPGVRTFLVEHAAGGRARVDFVLFKQVESPVAPSTWGAIKSLYR